MSTFGGDIIGVAGSKAIRCCGGEAAAAAEAAAAGDRPGSAAEGPGRAAVEGPGPVSMRPPTAFDRDAVAEYGGEHVGRITEAVNAFFSLPDLRWVIEAPAEDYVFVEDDQTSYDAFEFEGTKIYGSPDFALPTPPPLLQHPGALRPAGATQGGHVGGARAQGGGVPAAAAHRPGLGRAHAPLPPPRPP